MQSELTFCTYSTFTDYLVFTVRMQVSTWFANARRRLKKENKLQWTNAPGGEDHDRKSRDDDDDVDDDVSNDFSDVIATAADYDLSSVEECGRSALDRRQMAPLTVPHQQAKDAANRLGKIIL